MSEPGEEDLLETPRSDRADRAEAIATLVALVWVGTAAVVLSVFGGNISLIGIMAIGPFIACAFARPWRVALVGGLGTFFALVISTPPHSYGTLNHLLRVITQIVATLLAMWISYRRGMRNVQLWTARTETRNERRRRVAAETAQRMQAMARALTTAADPAQVADAVFAALRDELHVDAATFALVGDSGQLRTLRRFGYDPDEPIDAVLPALRPDGPVLGQNTAFFAESLEDLRAQRGDLFATLASNRFSALAVVPMVVSDHTIGAVVVHWEYDREISNPDRTFLLTITSNAAQAVERARLTVTEFVNLERSQHLHRLSSALAAATTPGDVAHAAISGARRALGAQSAVVRIPDVSAHALFCLASSGHPSMLSVGMLPLDQGHSATCFSHGGTLVDTVGDGDEPGEDLAPELVLPVLAEVDGPVTVVSEPLIGSIGTLGILSLAFVGRPEPNEPDRRFLATLAGLTAQALERAQVFEHEREALRTAEAARERLSLLSEVTRLLSSSLEPTTVIRRTMTLVEGRLADVCVVQVPGKNGLVRLDVRGPHGREERRDGRTEEVGYDSDTPAAVAFQTGRTQLALIDDAGRPLAELQVGGAPSAEAVTADAFTALAVPLTANGEVIGVMTFIDGPGRAFEEDDVSLATEVASRAGVALSNATRFQREHVVAEVLQRSVLPEFLPDVEGLRLDAEYRAGIAGTYAGGDWYDVFPVGDDAVFFSVGDVMGKGAPAAALMGQVRSAIRAYAVSGQSPSEVLTSLDRLFDALVEDRVVTAIVGRVNPATGHVEMSNAGHPPPLHVRADGTAAYCPMQGSLLIAAGLSGTPRAREELMLDPGESLVMYSDGLIEHRGELITDGMDRLAAVAGDVAKTGWPDRPAVTFASMMSEEERTDDVVVLCVHRDAGERIAPAQVGRSRVGMAVLELEPAVESTPLARHWVTAHLVDVPSEVSSCAALLTSELVTNAVLHAATPICVTLHVLPDRIRVDVADRSTTIPAVKDYGRDAATGRGLTLFSTLASDWGVQVTEGGKIVWFELPVDFPVPPVSVSDGTFRFDLAGITQFEQSAAPDATPQVQVRLRGIPVALLQKSSEEYEALFRELRLMKERGEVAAGTHALPERLAVLVSGLGTRFSGLGPGMDEVWQDALDERLEFFDWTLDLPESAAPACEFYDAMLDEADEFAHSARLLTLPASPTSVAVRRWFLSQLISQLRGRDPVAWVDSPQHAELAALPGR